jgi:phosphoenolpyruvate-protein kinase (PTS system EI component)
MKKSIYKLSLVACLLGGTLIGCNTPAEKVADAQNTVDAANQDLDQANREYLADVEKYRKEASEKIATNEKSIAEFNARMANEKSEAKAAYQQKITAIEQKNSDMKKKMDEYKAEGKDQWEKFKIEFSHDMDELGNAFKNLTTSDNK